MLLQNKLFYNNSSFHRDTCIVVNVLLHEAFTYYRPITSPNNEERSTINKPYKLHRMFIISPWSTPWLLILVMFVNNEMYQQIKYLSLGHSSFTNLTSLHPGFKFSSTHLQLHNNLKSLNLCPVLKSSVLLVMRQMA